MLSRRQFLRSASTVAAGLCMARFAGRARAAAASEKIVAAHIGVGGMGNGHVNWFASFPDVEIAAICDVDERHRMRTLDRLRSLRPETKAEAYGDFRQVLDRKDIDVVTCATPDHWHALITILAFQAGKDVYSEKPLSYSLAEGRAMLKAGRRYGRIFQLGTQIHAGDNYHRVVELVRSGVLGKIHTVRIWMAGGSPGLGFPADEPPPTALDWDMWLGPAPWHAYNRARCHFNFRYFWDYSGGVFADFWCHIADVVFWALGPMRPTTVEACGEEPHDGIATASRWIDVDYEFVLPPGKALAPVADEGLKVYWTSRTPDVPGAEGKGIGAQFVGTEGSLVCDYGSRVILLGEKRTDDIPEVPTTLPRSPGHQRNFLDSVKSRAPTECPLEYVHPMAIPMHLGNISLRLRRKLTWDGAREQFVGDEVADRMLFRPYRPPWRLPT